MKTISVYFKYFLCFLKKSCNLLLLRDNGNFVWKLRNDKIALVSLALLLLLIFSAIMAPWLAPSNPYDLANLDILNSEIPPSWLNGGQVEFILGTDAQGRDMFSTILYGLRISLIIGILAVLLQAFIGIIIGLIAGYFGGFLDSLLMRFADIQLSLSTMMIAIIALALFKSAFGTQVYGTTALIILVMVIGLAEWPQYARTIRAQVLAEKHKEYVQATQVMGFSPLRIMFKHILPNCLAPILVISTVQVANAIITEAALSFLGLGMPVTEPSLGGLIKSGYDYILSGQWWITIIPGGILVLLILVINLLGDWLRDTLNPKLYKG